MMIGSDASFCTPQCRDETDSNLMSVKELSYHTQLGKHLYKFCWLKVIRDLIFDMPRFCYICHAVLHVSVSETECLMVRFT